ncbi:DUF6777 domain-containing protein [Streptomyces sp. NPDC052236]|uniref:DUF6777 domain-containing protein n=1 Tax=Streptomyces sp. NPDC052236 TaxID=3365686 RepID=UPI0037D38FE6
MNERRENVVRSPMCRWYAPVAALPAVLSVALLAAGCGGGSAPAAGAGPGADADKVLLQPVDVQGPDPYTASTARNMTAPSPRPTRPGTPSSPPAGMAPLRTVSGSAPGLYGGTEAIGSCDVDRLVGLLGANRAKARAFTRAAGVAEADLPGFLHGLTPVVLRADTRVTSHGFRAGSATGFQSVLQAGTAVLVDQYGAPRVRCASGNPLKPPVAVQGKVVHKGKPWPGYRPERAVVIQPATAAVDSLLLVEVVNHTWVERKTGSDGERDVRPATPPAAGPDDVLKDPRDTEPPAPNASRPAGPANPTPNPANPANPANPTANPTGPTGPSDEPDGLSTVPAPPPDCPAPVALDPGEEPSLDPAIPPDCPMPAEPEEPELNPPAEPPAVPDPEAPALSDPPFDEELVPSEPDPFATAVDEGPDAFQG